LSSWTAKKKNKAIFDFLVSKGADADAKDNSGLTPNALLPRSRPTVPKDW
jgi:ankyrin repeat protein